MPAAILLVENLKEPSPALTSSHQLAAKVTCMRHPACASIDEVGRGRISSSGGDGRNRNREAPRLSNKGSFHALYRIDRVTDTSKWQQLF